MATAITGPSEIRKNVWIPSFQLTPYTVKHDKKFMITKWVASQNPLEHLVGLNGQIGQTDGIQATYAEVNNGVIDVNKTWLNVRGNGWKLAASNLDLDAYASSMYYSARPNAVVIAQIHEDSGLGDPDATQANAQLRFDNVERIYAKCAEFYTQRDGVAVIDNELYDDYFSVNYGWATSSNMVNLGYTLALLGMSSQDEAQKILYSDGNSTRNKGYYYSRGGYNYRHRLSPGYPEGFGTQGDAQRPYTLIYNFERNYIAMSNRKMATYGHGTFEGLVFTGADRTGVWQAFPVRGANGDLIRLSSIEAGYEMIKTQAFLSILLGDRYIIWDDNGKVGIDDLNFNLAYYGGEDTWKNRWRPSGGGVVQYNPNDPSHPKSNNNGDGFPTNPACSNNASWEANYIYGQIYTRCNSSLKWATFSYSQDGGSTQNGYFDGNTPQQGTLGAEVSRFGKSNVGQANVVHQYYNGKKPIVFEGTGTNSTKVYVVLNVLAGPIGSTTYNITGGPTITHVGDGIGIYIP